MSTPTNPPNEGRWIELARGIENLTGQVRALADAGDREPERVSGLEQTSRQLQEAVSVMAQRQGIGASGAGERIDTNALVGKNVVPEGLTNRSSFKQWSRRYKLVAGAKDERFKVLLEWAQARDPNEPAVDPAASNVANATRLSQHIYASLLMSTESGTEAHSIVDNTPAENGLEAWRRFVQKFDPVIPRRPTPT